MGRPMICLLFCFIMLARNIITANPLEPAKHVSKHTDSSSKSMPIDRSDRILMDTALIGVPIDAVFDSSTEGMPFDSSPEDTSFDSSPEDTSFDSSPEDTPFDSSPEDTSFDSSPEDTPFDSSPEDTPFDSSPVHSAFDSSSTVTAIAELHANNNANAVATPTGGVTLIATPPDVVDQLTETLDLTCSYSQTKDIGVTSLVLYKADTVNKKIYRELATVTFLTRDKVDVMDRLGASDVTGMIDNESQTYYIHYRWHSPGATTVGGYRCVANVMHRGWTQTKSITTKIVGNEPNIGNLLGKVKELDARLSTHHGTLMSVINEVNYVEKDMTDFVKKVDNHASQVNEAVGGLINKTERLQELIERYYPKITWSTTLSPVTTFKGHEYFLSAKNKASSVFQCLELCHQIGGHLVEVDCVAEWNFITQFVQKHNHSDYVYISGTDMNDDGTWNYFRHGKTMTYFPEKLEGNINRLCLAVKGGNHFVDYMCTAPSPMQCICEKQPVEYM